MNWHKKVISAIHTSRVPHRNFDLCSRDLTARIDACGPGELIYIYGPTRVGKTMLLKYALELIYGRADPKSDHLTYAIVTASNASRAGEFSTRGLTRRALRAVCHPIHSDLKTIAGHSTIRYSLEKKSEDELREEFVDMLMCRQTQCMGFDEMQNTRFVPGGYERAAWFLDSLKCAAADAGAIFIIIGTYELLPVIHLCPQIIGRSDAVHFPRYKPDSEADIIAWEQILDAYSSLIPFKKTSGSLRDWNEYLFKGSYGCVGLLDKWIRSAVSTAGHNGSQHLTLECLKHTYRSERELHVLGRSIAHGEAYLADVPATTAQAAPEIDCGEQEGTQPRRTRRPFQKNVRRYTGSERLVS